LAEGTVVGRGHCGQGQVDAADQEVGHDEDDGSVQAAGGVVPCLRDGKRDDENTAMVADSPHATLNPRRACRSSSLPDYFTDDGR